MERENQPTMKNMEATAKAASTNGDADVTPKNGKTQILPEASLTCAENLANFPNDEKDGKSNHEVTEELLLSERDGDNGIVKIGLPEKKKDPVPSIIIKEVQNSNADIPDDKAESTKQPTGDDESKCAEVAETPVAKTPVAKTPVAKTPMAKTPMAKTPVAGITEEKVRKKMKKKVGKTPVAKTAVAGTTEEKVREKVKRKVGEIVGKKVESTEEPTKKRTFRKHAQNTETNVEEAEESRKQPTKRPLHRRHAELPETKVEENGQTKEEEENRKKDEETERIDASNLSITNNSAAN